MDLVVCSPPDRLAARLTKLLASWRVAARVEAQLQFLWGPVVDPPEGPRPRIDIELFFDLARSDIHGPSDPLDLRIVTEPPTLQQNAVSVVKSLTGRDPRKQAVPLGPLLRSSGSICDTGLVLRKMRFEDEEDDDIRRDMRARFHRFTLRREVGQARDRVLRLIGSEFVVFHIRRGDIQDGLMATVPRNLEMWETDRAAHQHWIRQFLKRSAPLPSVVEAVRRESAAGRSCVIATDSPQVLRTIRAELPTSPVLAFHDLAIDRHPDVRDFAEFLTIMRAVRIYGGAGSNYTHLASTLGGTEFVDLTIGRDPEPAVEDWRSIVSRATPTPPAPVLELLENWIRGAHRHRWAKRHAKSSSPISG